MQSFQNEEKFIHKNDIFTEQKILQVAYLQVMQSQEIFVKIGTREG